jgi:26S proteasome regulatory subunit N5
VVKKVVYAKIDRPAGIVNFVLPAEPDDVLNEWSFKAHHLLDLVVKADHLIAKEALLYQLKH